FILYFFFQAEDGIRDRNVTGVQTCALPILKPPFAGNSRPWKASFCNGNQWCLSIAKCSIFINNTCLMNLTILLVVSAIIFLFILLIFSILTNFHTLYHYTFIHLSLHVIPLFLSVSFTLS